MSVLPSSIPVEPLHPRRPAWLSRRALAVWWLLGGATLLAFIGNPPVQRTQEARVLETAREMLDADWRQWLIPRLNGELRIRKPPLTYWLAAGAFKVGGVGELAGRIPSAFIGWLTLGVTFLAAQHTFGRRAAFFSAAALLTSYLFYRHSRLAETDGPAALFVTCGIYAFLRAAGTWDEQIRFFRARSSAADRDVVDDVLATEAENESFQVSPDDAIRPPMHTGWLFVGAAAAGLAFFSKGGPGLFPLIFLVALAAVLARWDLIVRFFTSGAVVLLIIGLSWYAYAAYRSGFLQFSQEMHELSSGEDHGKPFYEYFPLVFIATLPWTGLMVVGMYEAIRRCKADPRHRVMLAWVAATFVPLWFIGNKQFHYLMGLMPPLMVLTGWIMATVVDDQDQPAAGRAVLLATLVASFAGISLLPFVARHEMQIFRRADVIFCGGLLTLLAGAAWSYRAGGRLNGLVAMLISGATAMPLLTGLWYPSLRPHNSRAVAEDIRRWMPMGPYRFYGPNFSIPLCFNLRSEIHLVMTRHRLTELGALNPGMGVIAQTKSGRAAPILTDGDDAPVRFRYITRVLGEEQSFDLYRAEPRTETPVALKSRATATTQSAGAQP